MSTLIGTMCAVALGISGDRRLTTVEDFHALVLALRDAHVHEPETAAIEWKRSLDLDDADVRFELARHLLGFANRSVAAAMNSYAGFAYLLIGVSPGELRGVELADPARFDDAMARFIAPGHPHWELKLVEVVGITVGVLEVPPPRPGDRIATLQRAHRGAEPGRIFVRRAGKTAEASPDEVRMLEERFAQPSSDAAARDTERHEIELRRLALEEERAAAERLERAESRAARFMPSTRSDGFSLNPASARVSGALVNAGGTGTVLEALLRPERGGAYPGALSVVYGSGPADDPLGRPRVEQGVGLQLRFTHSALAALEHTSLPMTLEIRSVDDEQFETTEILVLRRDGANAQGHDRWTLRPQESRRTTVGRG